MPTTTGNTITRRNVIKATGTILGAGALYSGSTAACHERDPECEEGNHTEPEPPEIPDPPEFQEPELPNIPEIPTNPDGPFWDPVVKGPRQVPVEDLALWAGGAGVGGGILAALLNHYGYFNFDYEFEEED